MITGSDIRSISILTQLANGAIKIIEDTEVNYYIYNESFVVADCELEDGIKKTAICHCFPKTKANLQAWGLTYALSL